MNESKVVFVADIIKKSAWRLKNDTECWWTTAIVEFNDDNFAAIRLILLGGGKLNRCGCWRCCAGADSGIFWVCVLTEATKTSLKRDFISRRKQLWRCCRMNMQKGVCFRDSTSEALQTLEISQNLTRMSENFRKKPFKFIKLTWMCLCHLHWTTNLKVSNAV